MQPQIILLIVLAGSMLLLIGAVTFFSNQKALDGIKSKTVGDGQHGTARWATPKEIQKTYVHIPFRPTEWRAGKNMPKAQGLILGSEGVKNKVTALVDNDDIHCLMIGASGVGKTAFFLYPNLEYACASGMSYLALDTKGDLARNYGTIAKDCYGYQVSVIDLRNPTRSDGNNFLALVNRYMDITQKEPANVAARAKAEKYAKILSKTIINPSGDDANYGQNAFFYDAAEGLLTSVILLLAEFLPPKEIDGEMQERRHIVSVFKLVQDLLEPSQVKGKSQFQLLMGKLPSEHKASWFAGAALGKYFGSYWLPVPLDEAEGKLVVTEEVEGCPLAAGDVLVSLNGESIDALAEAAKKYYSITRDEVFLKNARYSIASSETEDIEVTVLRGEETLTLSVKGTKQPIYFQIANMAPYEILDEDIGLINPQAIVDADTLHEAMSAVKDTRSLIIDLRQYPGGTDFMYLYYYLPSTYQECMIYSQPAQVTPGSYIKHPYICGYNPSILSGSKNFYPWEKPVVVLMDKTTMSFSEMAVTIFGTDDNVVVLGENSMGSDGNMVYMPLPGGIGISFTSIGCYEVDGTQTQRTGITPDIPVSRTIQGIKEGRDELMEAAIRYLINTR